MRVLGFSFQTSDIRKAERIYSELFGWKVRTCTESHLEFWIETASGLCLIFSPKDQSCPTDPGTLTLLASSEERVTLESQKLWKECFQKEYADPKERYSSWLDPWKNRIWIFTVRNAKDS